MEGAPVNKSCPLNDFGKAITSLRLLALQRTAMYRSRPEEHKGIEHAILIAKAYIACILQSISVQAVERSKLHGTDTVIILDTYPVCRLLVTLQCSLAAEK